MCHVSELDVTYVKNPQDFCKVGDKMEVKLIAIDDLGRMKLSRRAVIAPGSENVPAPGGGGERRGGGGGGRGGGRGGDRGDRGPRREREGSGGGGAVAAPPAPPTQQ
jgi:polyribonucleotide nucleotidyltransferase